MTTKALLLNETGKDIANALWSINARLTAEDLTFKQMRDIIVSGGAPKNFPEGTTFKTVKGDYTYLWMFMHNGNLSDGRPYSDVRVMEAVDIYQFDSAEAFYYCETTLSAGTYYFEVETTWYNAIAGNYKFTLPADIPAGSQLAGLDRIADVGATGCSVKVYASAASTTPLYTLAITSGSGGTKLCTLRPAGDTNDENVNSIQRAGYGSNNYAQSAIRQYLNSDKAAGAYWTPKGKFDRPPSWNNSLIGFKAKLPDDFLDIVSPVKISTVTNNIFETDGYTITSSYATDDMFWLPSRYQIFGSTEGSDLSETQWNYYRDATDVDRIMYDRNGTARAQWMRSPYVGGAISVRDVDTSGALSNGYAHNRSASSPACRIYARKASE